MKKIIFSIFLLGIINNINSQSIYYVSTTGNNSNNGISIANAWETIQYAMDNVTPNSVVNILSGTYNEQLTINISGTSSSQSITFQNYNSDVVILDGSGLTGESMIEISGKEFITIDGLTITNNEHNYAKGIFILDGSDNILISNCEISNINFSSNANATVNSNTNSNPLLIYGGLAADTIHNIYINNCEIHDNRTGYSEALTIVGNVDGFEIGDCIIRDNTNIGIDIIGGYGDSSNPNNDFARNGRVHHNTCFNNNAVYANAGNIYVDGARNIVIENNSCYDGQYGIEVGAEEIGAIADNVIVRNNSIYNNTSAGLRCGGYNYPSTGKVTNSIFSGNTLVGNNTSNSDTEIVIAYAENCVFENNIILAASNLLLYHEFDSPNLTTFNYNCWWTPSGISGDGEFSYFNDQYIQGFSNFQSTTGQATNSLFDNPYLLNDNIANLDIHLQTTSPCIDAGNPSYVVDLLELDIDDNDRVTSSIIDMGSDELVTSTSNITIENSSITIDFDPSDNIYTISGVLTNFDIIIYDDNGTIISDLTGQPSPLEINLTSLGTGAFYLEIAHQTIIPLSIYKNIKDQ